MKDKQLERDTLIYFYENGIDTNGKILLELMSKKRKIDKETIEKWMVDNNINRSDYYCIFDEDYPRPLYEYEDAPYIIKKVVYENTLKN